jgi:hypothetical protein
MFEHNHKKRRKNKHKRKKNPSDCCCKFLAKGAGPNDLQEHMAARCYVFGAEL